MKYIMSDGQIIYTTKELPQQLVEDIYKDFDKIFNDKTEEEDI